MSQLMADIFDAWVDLGNGSHADCALSSRTVEQPSPKIDVPPGTVPEQTEEQQESQQMPTEIQQQLSAAYDKLKSRFGANAAFTVLACAEAIATGRGYRSAKAISQFVNSFKQGSEKAPASDEEIQAVAEQLLSSLGESKPSGEDNGQRDGGPGHNVTIPTLLVHKNQQAQAERRKALGLSLENRVPSSWLQKGVSFSNGEHKFSSTQFELPESLAIQVRVAAAKIAEDDLAEDGREQSPHITIKYGLHTNDAKEVANALSDFGPIGVSFGEVSLFPATDAAKYDVVKIDVLSEDLHRLNKLLSDTMAHTDTHPGYKPHVTLAYVKPGVGQKYVGPSGLEESVVLLDKLNFSDSEGKKTLIDLESPTAIEAAKLEAGQELDATEREAAKLAMDASGHEHKDKGPEGGQFANKAGNDAVGGDRRPRLVGMGRKVPR